MNENEIMTQGQMEYINEVNDTVNEIPKEFERINQRVVTEIQKNDSPNQLESFSALSTNDNEKLNGLVNKINEQEKNVIILTTDEYRGLTDRITELENRPVLQTLKDEIKTGIVETLSQTKDNITKAFKETVEFVKDYYKTITEPLKVAIEHHQVKDISKNYAKEELNLDRDDTKDYVRGNRDEYLKEEMGRIENRMEQRTAEAKGVLGIVRAGFLNFIDKSNLVNIENKMDTNKILDGVVDVKDAAVDGVKNLAQSAVETAISAKKALTTEIDNVTTQAKLSIAETVIKVLQPTVDKAQAMVEQEGSKTQVTGRGFNHFDKDESDFRADEVGGNDDGMTQE